MSHATARSYLDILIDFYRVRQVRPWSGNTKKRPVKSPRIYPSDTGRLHSLLSISDFDDLRDIPVVGASREGFVVENIIAYLPGPWHHRYYRTAEQAK